ncbi:MAG: peptidase C1, partial [Phaeodactylibacter sp.]|nr:peptidase C1 [Phaeodactylibacter sp.]
RLLPFLLLFLFRKPKLLIPILLIGAIWYFFLGGQETLSGGTTVSDNNDQQGDFSFGAALSEEEFDKAEVFAPLSYGSYSQYRIPSSVSLSDYAPKRLHQGQQGSCVGWATSYAARTILQAQATNQAPNNVAFSPSFLYNQIALSGCNGAYMRNALEVLRTRGDLPYNDYPYTDQSCSKLPNNSQQQQAQQFRIKGYNRLTAGAGNYTIDLDGVKQHLAQGAPVVIGMQVGGTFMQAMRGREVWNPNSRDRSLMGYSGHAMCVIGYDDNKSGGAFQIMNSWGESWGQDGIAWVRYADFEYFVKEAYGLYPMGTAPKYDPDKLAVKFGLVDNATQQLIKLTQVGNRIYKTQRPITKGEKFKAAVTNTIESYIYIFGEETDGSSYVLFPYTSKHSAYCGITGTRLFPKDYSMVADNMGTTDQIAIVVSKVELNYDALNRAINNSRARSYADKLQEAIASVSISNVQFTAGQTVEFNATTQGNQNAVGVVIQIDKR